MIIHVARKIVNNEEVENKLKYKIEKLCKYSSNAIDDYDYNQEFIKSFINKGLDINNLEWVISDVALYKKLIENIKEFLPELSIKHQYSKTKDENDDSVGDKIIVGSNLIERGVTFNELRLTYMGFSSKEPQADTIIQRARWFGYRDATEMQTVFLPKELITKYEESNFAQKELYEKLATNEGLTEVIDDGFASPFNPTRKTVNISVTYVDIDTFSSRQRKIRDDINNYNFEFEQIEKMINEFGVEKYSKGWNHGYIKIPVQILIDKYQGYLNIVLDKVKNTTQSNIDSFVNRLHDENIENLHIMLPRYYKNSSNTQFINTRKIYGEDEIEISQGKEFDEKIGDERRPNDNKVLEKYCFKNEITFPIIQIQAHIIRVKNKVNNELLSEEYFYAIIKNNIKGLKGVVK